MTDRPSRSSARGFTLVEMAVVLLILAILAGGLTAGLSAQVARRNEAETDAVLDEARDALLGYALRRGTLPCPAKSGSDGAEDRESLTTCRGNRLNGLLPWAELGISGLDAWGRRLHYAVAPDYVKAITLDSAGKLDIRTRNSAGTELTLTTAIGAAPALVLSHGPNGLGGIDADGNALAAPPAGSDEARNATAGSTLFYARSLSENSDAAGGAFDDRVVWVSPYLIANRLASAGRLP